MIKPLLLLVAATCLGGAPVVRHPHFKKTIEVELTRPGGGELKATVSHLTVTFDKDGFAATKVGGAWHLANAHIETTGPVEIGGSPVEAGKYRVVARKKDDKSWELVLDEPGRFSAKLGEKAKALQTTFRSDAPRREHLRIDIEPSGEKDKTVVDLVVQFDVHEAKTRIVIPKG